MLIKICKVSFWLSMALGFLGQIISFAPFAALKWFAIAAILIIPGFAIRGWAYRSASVVFLVAWLWGAYLGYVNGQRYQEWLNERGVQESAVHSPAFKGSLVSMRSYSCLTPHSSGPESAAAAASVR